MHIRSPALLLVAVALLSALIAWASLGSGDRAETPSRPTGGAEEEAEIEPPPFAPNLPISSLPPEVLTPAGREEAAPKPGEDPVMRLGRLAMNRVGALLSEYVDVEAYLDPAEKPSAELIELPEEVRTLLLNAVASESAEARLHAAIALSAVKLDEREIEVLSRRMDDEMTAMKSEAEKNVVLALAYALAAHDDRHGVERLADALRTGEGAEVENFRNGAVMVLGLADDVESAPLLRELLDADPDRVVRKHAATGLGKFGGEENAAALADALVREEDIEVRAWTALASGRVAPAGSGGSPALLTTLAEDTAGEVRGAAAYALARVGGEGTAETLTEAFYRDDHPLTRIGSVAGIARRGEGPEFLASEGAPFLMETAVGGQDSVSRYYATTSLALMPAGEPRSATLRTVISEDSSRWVRSAAVQTLVNTEGEAALPFLKGRLEAETSDRMKRQIEGAIRRLEE